MIRFGKFCKLSEMCRRYRQPGNRGKPSERRRQCAAEHTGDLLDAMPPPPPPLAAPLLLLGAGCSILVGTHFPATAWFSFGWGACLCFLLLNIVMFSRSIPSALLLAGGILSLASSGCSTFGGPSGPAVCHAILGIPIYVRPALAFSGPALLVWVLQLSYS